MSSTICDLPDDEARRIVKHLQGMIPRMSHAKLISYILALSLENARLAREVNQHRKTLGIEPMKLYIPGEL